MGEWHGLFAFSRLVGVDGMLLKTLQGDGQTAESERVLHRAVVNPEPGQA